MRADSERHRRNPSLPLVEDESRLKVYVSPTHVFDLCECHAAEFNVTIVVRLSGRFATVTPPWREYPFCCHT